ncbi:spermidine/putrescine ABC transporter permease [Candidatus Dependentiae bacterium]|nr:MAG: spermidine/putrescine ABC transporter permease [Candidatus Dependentiae bacterium]
MLYDRMTKFFTKKIDLFLAYPALVWQGYFLYIPLLVMIWFSFFELETYRFTLKHYSEFLDFVYLEIIFRSFWYSVMTSIICLILGYPLAYFLALKTSTYRLPLLFLLVLPSWTNIIVQMYAWFFLLQKNGFLYKVLLFLNIIAPDTRLLNTTAATLFGLVYCFLPFMTLPLYAVIEKLDIRLLEASADLGATKTQTFWRVVFPLSWPGIVAGTLLVFIPTFGEFAIPELLGGSKRLVWGMLIVNKFLIDRDFSGGAALTYLGLGLFMGAALFLYFLSKVHILINRLIVWYTDHRKPAFIIKNKEDDIYE